MHFEQANAIVTGAVSGLGLAVAEHLVAAGGQVALLDVDAQRGAAVVKRLGNRACYIETDVTNEAQVDHALATAKDTLGSITLVVNCAGIAPSHRVLAREGLMATSEFERVIKINLIGSFCVCRAAAHNMQHNLPDGPDGERGVIINTASIAAFEGQIGQAAYAASKGGIVSLALPLAREFARVGIRVLTIAPGLFETPMFETLPQQAREALKEATPFPHRLGQAQEFARLVHHIYENPLLNGSVIRLDGALRMPAK